MKSKDKFRVMLDVNIYIAAYLSPTDRSPNKELIQRWLEDEFTLLFSRSLLKEIIKKFNEKEIDSHLTTELIAHLLTLGEEVILTSGDIHPVITADPDDDIILASAVKGKAGYLITYDFHFDILAGTYKGIQIIEPLSFLFILRKQKE